MMILPSSNIYKCVIYRGSYIFIRWKNQYWCKETRGWWWKLGRKGTLREGGTEKRGTKGGKRGGIRRCRVQSYSSVQCTSQCVQFEWWTRWLRRAHFVNFLWNVGQSLTPAGLAFLHSAWWWTLFYYNRLQTYSTQIKVSGK